jgi:hypothetical protein
MNNIKEGQLYKNLGKTRRKTRWNNGKKQLSHHSSEKILGDNYLLESLE